MPLKIEAKFEGKLTCTFKNNIKKICKVFEAEKQRFHFRK